MSRPRTSRRALKHIRLVDSNTSTAGTVTLPADVIAGDLLVFNQYSHGVFSEPTYASPAGWTEVYSTAGSGEWQASGAYYKISDGTEGGTSVSGIDAAGTDHKTVAVFRGNRPFKSAQILTATVENTNNNPVAQTILTGAMKTPTIAVANFGANSAISPRTFSPAETHEINPTTGYYTKFKIMLGDYADISVDMDDESDRQHLASYALIPSIYDEEHATTASLATSSSNSTSTGITIPTSVEQGDVLILFDRASNGSGIPSAVTDSGWTLLASVTGSPHRFQILGKIAQEADRSTVIAGSSGDTTNHHVLMVFRGGGGRPFQTMTAFSAVSVAPVSTNPADIVITDQSVSKVRIHLASFSASAAVSPRSFSPAADGEVTPATVFYAAYRMLQAAAALGDSTIGMDDEGTGNTLLAVGVELT